MIHKVYHYYSKKKGFKCIFTKVNKDDFMYSSMKYHFYNLDCSPTIYANMLLIKFKYLLLAVNTSNQ